MNEALRRWAELVENVNGRWVLGQIGVRDPDYPCADFDARGYQENGMCDSDGHYLCMECSHLSPNAPRFTYERRGDER